MAQDADPPDPFQMLQILYKPFTKRITLEFRAPLDSGARSAKCSPNASNRWLIVTAILALFIETTLL